MPDPIAVGVGAMGLAWLSALVKLGVICGLTSVMLVLTYGQTRIFYTMAKDGLLPGLFSHLHPRFGTPARATILLGVLVALIAALTPIKLLGELVSIGTLFAFAVVCGAVLYLRRHQPDLPRPFRCPGVPWVPLGRHSGLRLSHRRSAQRDANSARDVAGDWPGHLLRLWPLSQQSIQPNL